MRFFPVQFASLCAADIGAKLRVAEFQVEQVAERAARLRMEMTNAPVETFPDWNQRSHLLVLDRAVSFAARHGVTPASIRTSLLQEDRAGANAEEFIKDNFQREAVRQLLAVGPSALDVRKRFEHKLMRWRLPG